jgi:phosphate transport system substrate-binding protein
MLYSYYINHTWLIGDYMKLVYAIALICAASTAQARDNIQVTGSSTVLPYATIVAESFGENFEFPSPVVEGGGSGAGRKKLCEGVGENTVDIANSSSKMKEEEWAKCEEAIGTITEVRIGYDGIVFASNIDQLNIDNLTVEQLYKALHESSAAKLWSDVDPALPEVEILAYIPGTKHGTREVFDVKVMEDGCKAALGIEKLDDEQKKACVKVRTDGAAIDIDGDYTETLSRLDANPTSLGVFGLSFYQNNTDKLEVSTVDGVFPSVETISSGDYPISRPLYFYVKNAHLGVIPGLKEFVEFFVSDDMAGEGGALAQYGLVPDPELTSTQELVNALQ